MITIDVFNNDIKLMVSDVIVRDSEIGFFEAQAFDLFDFSQTSVDLESGPELLLVTAPDVPAAPAPAPTPDVPVGPTPAVPAAPTPAPAPAPAPTPQTSSFVVSFKAPGNAPGIQVGNAQNSLFSEANGSRFGNLIIGNDIPGLLPLPIAVFAGFIGIVFQFLEAVLDEEELGVIGAEFVAPIIVEPDCPEIQGIEVILNDIDFSTITAVPIQGPVFVFPDGTFILIEDFGPEDGIFVNSEGFQVAPGIPNTVVQGGDFDDTLIGRIELPTFGSFFFGGDGNDTIIGDVRLGVQDVLEFTGLNNIFGFIEVLGLDPDALFMGNLADELHGEDCNDTIFGDFQEIGLNMVNIPVVVQVFTLEIGEKNTVSIPILVAGSDTITGGNDNDTISGDIESLTFNAVKDSTIPDNGIPVAGVVHLFGVVDSEDPIVERDITLAAVSGLSFEFSSDTILGDKTPAPDAPGEFIDSDDPGEDNLTGDVFNVNYSALNIVSGVGFDEASEHYAIVGAVPAEIIPDDVAEGSTDNLLRFTGNSIEGGFLDDLISGNFRTINYSASLEGLAEGLSFSKSSAQISGVHDFVSESRNRLLGEDGDDTIWGNGEEVNATATSGDALAVEQAMSEALVNLTQSYAGDAIGGDSGDPTNVTPDTLGDGDGDDALIGDVGTQNMSAVSGDATAESSGSFMGFDLFLAATSTAKIGGDTTYGNDDICGDGCALIDTPALGTGDDQIWGDEVQAIWQATAGSANVDVQGEFLDTVAQGSVIRAIVEASVTPWVVYGDDQITTAGGNNTVYGDSQALLFSVSSGTAEILFDDNINQVIDSIITSQNRITADGSLVMGANTIDARGSSEANIWGNFETLEWNLTGGDAVVGGGQDSGSIYDALSEVKFSNFELSAKDFGGFNDIIVLEGTSTAWLDIQDMNVQMLGGSANTTGSDFSFAQAFVTLDSVNLIFGEDRIIFVEGDATDKTVIGDFETIDLFLGFPETTLSSIEVATSDSFADASVNVTNLSLITGVDTGTGPDGAIELGDGNDIVIADGQTFSLQAIAGEAFIAEGDGNFAQANAFVAGLSLDYASERIDAGGGDDRIFADGEDINVEVIGGTASVGDGDNNFATAEANLQDTFIQTGDDIVNGGDGNDFIVGDPNMSFIVTAGTASVGAGINNSATALAIVIGNTIITGVDIIDGGAGDDVIFGDGETFELIVTGSIVEGNRITFGSDILLGGDGNDTMFGDYTTVDIPPEIEIWDGEGEEPDQYIRYGNDFFEGGLGDDFMDGSKGSDTSTYENAPGSVFVNLTLPTEQATGAHGTDTFALDPDTLLSSIENIIGSNFDDIIIGDIQDNIIEGKDGDDIIDGGEFPGDTDKAIYREPFTRELLTNFLTNPATTPMQVFMLTQAIMAGEEFNYAMGIDGDGVDFDGITIEALNSDEGTDTLVADVVTPMDPDSSSIEILEFSQEAMFQAFNLINGVADNTTVEDVAGADRDDVEQRDLMVGGENNGPSYTMSGELGHDILIGGANIASIEESDALYTLLGGDGNDVLVGGSNFDDLSAARYVLSAGAGNDVLIGGFNAGAFYEMFGGSGDDLLVAGQNDGGIYGLSGDAGDDTLTAVEGDHTLIGGEGNDLLDGGESEEDNDTAIYFGDVLEGNIRNFIDGSVSADDLGTAAMVSNYAFSLINTGETFNTGIVVEDLVGTDGTDTIVADVTTPNNIDTSSIETISFALNGLTEDYNLINGVETLENGDDEDLEGVNEGADLMVGGINNSTGIYQLSSGAEDDIIIAAENTGSGQYNLDGEEGNDILLASNIGNHTLTGGFGDDLLDGGEQAGNNDQANYFSDVLDDNVRMFVNGTVDGDAVVAAPMIFNYDFRLNSFAIIAEDLNADLAGDEGTDLIIADVNALNDITTSSIETINFAGLNYNLINGVFSNAGFETISGADRGDVDQRDLMVGGTNNGVEYIMDGGNGDDVVFGGNNNGVLYRLDGGFGNDILKGGDNNGGGLYILNAFAGNDVLIAGDNNDGTYRLNGGPGDNVLLAAAGDHILVGDVGDDILDGGESPGDDDRALYFSDILNTDLRTFVNAGATPSSAQIAAVLATVVPGMNQLNYFLGLEGDGTLPSGIRVEDQVGTDGNDLIIADVTTLMDNLTSSIETIDFAGQTYNLINGVATLNEGIEDISGADRDAVDDRDLMIGGINNAEVYGMAGGDGDDILVGDTNNGVLYRLDGNAGTDLLIGAENTGGSYILNAFDGNDILIGKDNNGTEYRLNGGSGNNVLIGFAGDHILTGAAGDDTLDGGESPGNNDSALYFNDVLSTSFRTFVGAGTPSAAQILAVVTNVRASTELNYLLGLVENDLDGITVEDRGFFVFDDGADTIIADVDSLQDETTSSIETINFMGQAYNLINGVISLDAGIEQIGGVDRDDVADRDLMIGGFNQGQYDMSGNEGDDILVGGTHEAAGDLYRLFGNNGNDILIAGINNAGTYRLNGGLGNDILLGHDAGNHVLIGDGGNDVLDGGEEVGDNDFALYSTDSFSQSLRVFVNAPAPTDLQIDALLDSIFAGEALNYAFEVNASGIEVDHIVGAADGTDTIVADVTTLQDETTSSIETINFAGVNYNLINGVVSNTGVLENLIGVVRADVDNRDLMVGGVNNGGRYELSGRDGIDFIIGGLNNGARYELNGDAGSDVLVGGVNGALGNLYFITGGAGNDVIFADVNDGAAYGLLGNEGNDVLTASGGNHTLFGGTGDDVLNGGESEGDDDDAIYTSDVVNEDLRNFVNTDTPTQGQINAVIMSIVLLDAFNYEFGLDGDGINPDGITVDHLTGTDGFDTIIANVILNNDITTSSIETINFAALSYNLINGVFDNVGAENISGADRADFENRDMMVGGDNEATYQMSGGLGHDFLVGGTNTMSYTLRGDEGNDILLGGDNEAQGAGSFYQLEGGLGNDILEGGENRGVLYELFGNAGVDIIIGGLNTDQGGTYQAFGGDGGDFIQGDINEGSFYLLDGEADNDRVVGDVNNGEIYQLEGGPGDDRLFAGVNNGTTYALFGEEGNDILNAVEGDHQLTGGTGNDRLDGGENMGDNDQGFYSKDSFSSAVRTFVDTDSPTQEQISAVTADLLANNVFNYNFAVDPSGIIVEDRDMSPSGDGRDVIMADVMDNNNNTSSSIETIIFSGEGYNLINGMAVQDSLIDILMGADRPEINNRDLMIGGINAGARIDISGGLGDDILIGGTNSGARYTLNGDAGNDVLSGGINEVGGLYLLNGGTDNDILIAEANNGDAYGLFGDDGDDILFGHAGTHILDGGEPGMGEEPDSDNDTALYRSDVLKASEREYITNGTMATAVAAAFFADGTALNYAFALQADFDGSGFDGISVEDINALSIDEGTDLIIADLVTGNNNDSSSIEKIEFAGETYNLINGVLLAADGDNIDGTPDADLIVGGSTLPTSFGTYNLSGNEANDIIIGGAHAGFGLYNLVGGTGNDVLWGADNLISIYTLDGGAGNDILFAGANVAGSYFLNGGAGDDILIGNAGNHILDGGIGNDITFYRSDVLKDDVRTYTIAPVIFPQLANLVIDAFFENKTLLNYDFGLQDDTTPQNLDGITIEDTNALSIDEGNDLIIADVTTPQEETSSSIETISFADGIMFREYTLINGVNELSLGVESINGTVQDDMIVGGDIAPPEMGTNSIINYTLIGNLGNDVIVGGNSDGTNNLSFTLYNLIGGTGNDILEGGDNTGSTTFTRYSLRGEMGNDILTAGNNIGAGLYTLNGGAGDDVLIAGGPVGDLDPILGSHTLIGGEGNDVLLGGADADTFIFDLIADIGNDDVKDFEVDTAEALVFDNTGVDNIGAFENITSIAENFDGSIILEFDADTANNTILFTGIAFNAALPPELQEITSYIPEGQITVNA